MSSLLGSTSAMPVTDTKRCACGHPEHEHDDIARRYCTATSSGELTRGCICRELSSTPRQ